MARQRKSKAALVLDYFQTENLDVAVTVYGLVSSIVKARVPKAKPVTKKSKVPTPPAPAE